MNPVQANPIRVILVDDHKLVRAGLRMLVDGMAGMTIVGEAGNGAEALALCATLMPDVVLLDIAMPVLNGLDALQQIQPQYPAVRVIILSMLASEEHVIRALSQGATGYLLKDSAPAELELAIRCVLNGETWLSPPISRQVVDGYLARVGLATSPEAGPQPGPQPGPDPLSERQREVLRLLALGRSTKEIAFELDISTKTIETHRAQIMKKLGLQDIASLTRYAIRRGIIPLD